MRMQDVETIGIANALFRASRFREAETAYKKHIETHPNSAGAHSGLASSISAQGRHKEAIYIGEQAVNLEPKNSMFLMRLGHLHMRSGKPEEAQRLYERAIEISPSDHILHASLSASLGTQGRLPEAIASLKTASKLQPGNPEYEKRLKDLAVPDFEFYNPGFSPWLGYGDFKDVYAKASAISLVGAPRCYVLYSLARQAVHLSGEFWECGVYKGGTAAMLAELLSRYDGPHLRLFDTFAGMPATDRDRDTHKSGDFSDTSLESVRSNVGHVDRVAYHEGFIPDTFTGLDDRHISFAHIDVDIYKSIFDCCKFVFPRLLLGGIMVFDDYGNRSCPGARAAVDEFFKDTKVFPLILATGQAIVFKNI